MHSRSRNEPLGLPRRSLTPRSRSTRTGLGYVAFPVCCVLSHILLRGSIREEVKPCSTETLLSLTGSLDFVWLGQSVWKNLAVTVAPAPLEARPLRVCVLA